MHYVSHKSESIWQMGSGHIFSTNIFEWLHIGNVNEAYQSTNKVNYLQKILNHNDRCSGPDYMEETLLYLTLQGWYDIVSAKVFNLLLAADKQRTMHRAHLLKFHHCQKEPFFCPVSQQVHHRSETHVCGMCRCIILTSLRDVSVDSGIPNFGQLFCTQIDDHWGHEVSALVLAYDQYVLIDGIFINLQTGLLYYRQPFYCPTSVECLGLDCKVEYTDANQGIMPESQNIWVQYTDSDLDNTFQGQVPSFPVLYISWTPQNQILQYLQCLSAGKTSSALSNRCKTTQKWILHPKPHGYAVVIRTKYEDPHGWADCVDRFIQVVKETDKIPIVHGGAMVGPVHMAQKNNAALHRIDSVWLVNNHVDLDTYWTVY